MTTKVDLALKMSESLGKHLPTLYVDFVDISYGPTEEPEDTADIIDAASEYSRYSQNPNNGTYMNGSLSIYLTKESSESNENLADWVREQLGDLYIYTWLSPYQTLNEDIKKGVLDLKQLFYAMTPDTRSTFDSNSPSYDAIISEMKDAFLGNGFIADPKFYHREWISNTSYTDSAENDTSFLLANIDTPGHWVYNNFWGSDGMEGPWRKVESSKDFNTSGEYLNAGYSFMNRFLSRTLYSYTGGGTGQKYSSGRRMNAYKLSDYIEADGSNVRTEGLYDQAGDQISVIVNLPIDFRMSRMEDDIEWSDAEYGNRGDSISYRLARLSSIYLIACVGNDVLINNAGEDDDGNALFPGELKDDFKEMNSLLFNANFGDITYEPIFSSPTGADGKPTDLQIADQKADIFVSEATGSPHPGNPIMSINGTYHADTPMGHAKIVSTMTQLLDNYADKIDTDRQLKHNLANIAHILASKDYTTDILRRLQFFRKTFVDKANPGNSGKLYRAFNKLLYSANRQVLKQARLKKVRVVNNKVIDSRVKAPNVSYVDHGGTGNAEGSLACTAGGPGSTTCKYYAGMVETFGDSAYIPKKWHYMTRRTVNTIPIAGRKLLTDMAQFILEEGAPKYYIDSDYYTYGTGGSVGAPEEGHAWAEYLSDFADGRATGAPVDTKIAFTAAEGSDSNLDYLGAGPVGEDGLPAATDVVVKNDGIFFFDYEKAIHTHSKLSFVISPSRIQKYLGLHVPYEYYKVLKVKLKRAENRFLTNMGEEYFDDLPHEESPKVNIVQTLELDSEKSYPSPKRSIYDGFVTDGDYSADKPNYRYGQPTVRLASTVDAGEIAEGGALTDDDYGGLASYAADSTYEKLSGTADSYSGEEGTAYNFVSSPYTYTPGGTSDTATAESLYAEQLTQLAQRYMNTVETDNTKEVPSYLRLVNFEAPMGVRPGPGTFANYPIADSANRPSGGLTNYEGWIVRGGYRVMCFEYNDYMDDDVAYYNTIGIQDFYSGMSGLDATMTDYDAALSFAEDRSTMQPTKYEVEIEVQDQSLRMMDDIYEYFSDEFENFVGNYYNHAIASCSYNNVDDRFNDFFANGINSSYPGAEQKPWIRAPYIFNIARTLLYKTFEDSETYDATPAEAMREQAAKIAKLIGPEDGRLMHLKRFKIDFEKLLNVIKPRSESDTETTLAGRRLFGSRKGSHSMGEYDSPLFNYHPVYDRVLEMAGTEAGDVGTSESASTYEDDSTISKLWEDACTSTHTYVFKNSFPIDKKIFGDMFLSSLYTWNYQPPSATINYSDMFIWIKNLDWILIPRAKLLSQGTVESISDIPDEIQGLYNRTDDEGHRSDSRVHFPPGKRTAGSLPSSMGTYISPTAWQAWINQTLLCAFIYKFRETLERGMQLPGGRLDTVTMYAIRDHILEIAAASADFSGDRAAAEEALSHNLNKLTDAYDFISYVGSTQGNKAHRLFNNNIWSKSGIQAICNIMQPVIVYDSSEEVWSGGFGFGGQYFHRRPRVLYTHIAWASGTGWAHSSEQGAYYQNQDMSAYRTYNGVQVQVRPPYFDGVPTGPGKFHGGFLTQQWGRVSSYRSSGPTSINRASDIKVQEKIDGTFRYILNFEQGLEGYNFRGPLIESSNARYRYADAALIPKVQGPYAETGWAMPIKSDVWGGGEVIIPDADDVGGDGTAADADGDGSVSTEETVAYYESYACVIATHAMSTGMFKTEDKANAVDWCTNKLHGRWWGEIMRRGYRYLGRKHIANGTAELVYDEFKECLEWANGKRPFELRIASRYAYRVAQTFIVGLFVKENK